MNKLTFVFFFSFLTLQLSSQIFFGSQNIINKPAIAEPSSLYPADIDGDGDIDILASSRGDSQISWFENIDGKGSYGLAHIIVKNFNSASLAIAFDVDGDNDLDVVYSSWGSDEIAWSENLDGKGNFGEKKILDDYASGVWSIRSGDVDSDGDLDLFAALREGKSIVWYENLDGLGQFSDKNIIHDSMLNTQDAFPADLDGDGDLDVVTSDWYAGEVGWHENLDGHGSFSGRKMISSNVDRVRNLSCVDIDSDGSIDVVCFTDSKLIWFQNLDGKGNFSGDKLIKNNHQPDKIISADVDGDGDMDVLSVLSSGKSSWFENTDGKGNFSDGKTIVDNFTGSSQIRVGDLDGDGDLDFIVGNYSTSEIYWYENMDDVGTVGNTAIINKPDFSGPQDFAKGDMDGDGDMDLIVPSLLTKEIILYENNFNSGSFSDAKLVGEGVKSPHYILTADLNGDSKLDILVASEIYGKVQWYKNLGNNVFEIQNFVAELNYGVTSIFSADLDGDNDLDVIVGSKTTSELFWFENTDGKGNFGTAKMISNSIERAYFITTVDLDEDGDEDIVTCSFYADKLIWFENTDGKGNFSAEKVVATGINRPKSVVVTDLDGDGDMDMAVSIYHKILWFENTDGMGSFGAEKPVSGSSSFGVVGELKAADPDEDGDMDLFVILEDKNQLVWFMNTDGMGSFEKQGVITDKLNKPTAIDVFDVDMDGKPDLVSTSFQDNKIAWYRNEIAPVFITMPEDAAICEQDEVVFTVEIDKSDHFEWQIKERYEYNFTAIVDDNQFSGSQTATLTIILENTNLNLAEFRCIVTYHENEFISDTALLTIDNTLEALAGNDQENCYGYAWLNGNFPAGGAGLWTVVQGQATIENPVKEYTKITDIQHGVNIFKWTITKGACIDSDEMEVVKYDSVSITAQAEDLNLILGEKASFSIQVDGDVNSFQWYGNGGALADGNGISGAETNHLIIDAVMAENEGDYYCYINGKCNYAESNQYHLSVITGVEDVKNNLVRLYPNPASSVLHIESDEIITAISVTDILGKTIDTFETGINQVVLNTADYPKGVYLFSIDLNNKTLIYKVIIE